MDATDWILIAQAVIAIIGIVIAVIGLIYAIRQVKFLASQVKENSEQIKYSREWDKKQAAFNYCGKYVEYIRTFDKDLLSKIGLISYEKPTGNTADFNELLKDEETRTHLYIILEYYEVLCAGIELNYFDETAAMRILYKALTSAYDKLAPYIAIRRADINSSSNENVDVYMNFEIVAKRWKANAAQIGGRSNE